MSHEERLKALLTLGERLDDIRRAQMWARIEDRIAEPPARRTWWPAAVAAAGVAALAIVVLARGDQHEPAALVAPADTTLSARLGPHARAALVGPARLEVVGTAGDATTVRLRAGMLMAEFEGGPGRSLRV
ncbi:MAG: hypothetical protein ACM31C_26800, partial [Acidobacteriota bacterium]